MVGNVTGDEADSTTTIPFDDAISQNTEGAEFLTQAITPKNASSTLIIDVTLFLSGSVGGTLIAALFQDSDGNAIAVACETTSANTMIVNLSFRHKMTAGTTSATTFKVRAGLSTAGTTTFNGSGAARKFGGKFASSNTITEILP